MAARVNQPLAKFGKRGAFSLIFGIFEANKPNTFDTNPPKFQLQFLISKMRPLKRAAIELKNEEKEVFRHPDVMCYNI